MEFFATCPKGFEGLLASELSSLGLSQVRRLKGQVSFVGDLDDAYKACLWSRLASRVVLILKRIDADDSESLYQGISTINWEDHVLRGATIAVDAHGINENLRNTQFIAMRTKDAIADRLQQKCGWRVQVDTSRPDLRIVIRLHDERASVGIDLSGRALFRRGYELGRNRVRNIVPLRADYAAALLASTSWFRNCRHDDPSLIVPFAGAGTILCEAASQAQHRAPGLLRQQWGFEGWGGHDSELWNKLFDDGLNQAEKGTSLPVHIVASDIRPHFDSYCRQILRAAGLNENIDVDFVVEPFKKDALAPGITKLPTLPTTVCNMSWIGPDDAALEAKALGVMSIIQEALPTQAPVSALATDEIIDAALKAQPEEFTRIFVGSADATLRTYTLDKEKEIQQSSVLIHNTHDVPTLMDTSEQFASRLNKMAKLRRKWAAREDITCYRVYDQDLPDYAVSIDIYEGIKKGRWAVISEYQAPKEIDQTVAKKRLLDALAITPYVLDIRPEDTFVRVRSHAKGGSQYVMEDKKPSRQDKDRRPGRKDDMRQRRRSRGPILPPGSKLVDEGGLTFEVNFEGRLDTGIFLDHRETRSMLREMMKLTKGSKRFLNLFAYTGTATCYAADGGAKFTTTVDMSRPYLQWAQRNMERNGFEGEQHEYVQADVIGWVNEMRHTKNRWDLIFCDPPTFTNSSSMRSNNFDVQRDHAELLIGISRLLTRNGTCVFSCNLRSFKPDVEKMERAGVSIEDITASTIPEDYSRNPKIHHCYIVKRFR